MTQANVFQSSSAETSVSYCLTRGRRARTVFGRRLAVILTALALVGCYRNATPAPEISDEQLTVDRATAALGRMRQSGQFPELERRLQTASGVMVFPRVVKAALLVGGGGGHGVALARDESGAWSAPAFYSLGGGSAGLALGYQEASVVIVFATRAALLTAVERGLTLGADATVTVGTIGTAGESSTATAARDVYTYVDVGGVFVGAALDGTVVDANESRNQRYYGPTATTYGILIDRRFDDPATRGLRAVLAGG